MILKVLVINPVSIAGRLIVSSISDGLRQNSLVDVDLFFYDELTQDNIEQVLTQDYDLIVGYDFSPLKIKVDYSLSARCLCYFADNICSKTSGPEWEKYYKYLYCEDVYTFFWDEQMISQYDFKNLWYLPQFVNFEVYKPLAIEPKIDVIFAGRLDTDIRLNTFVNLMLELPDLKFAWYAIERHYKDALNRTGHKALIEKAWQGFIDNEPDMAKATNEAKLGFTINAQGLSSLNYRTIQTIACKRLIISDERDEAKLYNGNLPCWNDFEDLKHKIRFYLSNPQEYNKTVEACYTIGRKNHHSKENVEFMLKKILVSNA